MTHLLIRQEVNMLRLFVNHHQLDTLICALRDQAKALAKGGKLEESNYAVDLANSLIEQSDMDHTRVIDLEVT